MENYKLYLTLTDYGYANEANDMNLETLGNIYDLDKDSDFNISLLMYPTDDPCITSEKLQADYCEAVKIFLKDFKLGELESMKAVYGDDILLDAKKWVKTSLSAIQNLFYRGTGMERMSNCRPYDACLFKDDVQQNYYFRVNLPKTFLDEDDSLPGNDYIWELNNAPYPAVNVLQLPKDILAEYVVPALYSNLRFAKDPNDTYYRELGNYYLGRA